MQTSKTSFTIIITSTCVSKCYYNQFIHTDVILYSLLRLSIKTLRDFLQCGLAPYGFQPNSWMKSVCTHMPFSYSNIVNCITKD